MNGSERTSLHLEELGSRIATTVMRRSSEGLTVSQELPFLRLSSGVLDATGRRASIDWVSVDIEGDTPSLVMELTYLQPEREDDTSPCFRIAKRRRDETMPFEIQTAAPRREVVVGPPVLAPRRTLTDQVWDAWAELRRDLGRFLRTLAQRLSPV